MGGGISVDLGGNYLIDDYSKPKKQQIPDNTNIRPGWRALFWADGRDTGKHANFLLSKNAEQLGIFSTDGAAIDTIVFSAQFADISFGRYPDGGNDSYSLEPPTPGSANTNQTFWGMVADPIIFLEDGFYQNSQSLTISCPDTAATIYYTTDSLTPDETFPLYTAPIAIESTTVIRVRCFKNGYYLSRVITSTFFINESVTLLVVSWLNGFG